MSDSIYQIVYCSRNHIVGTHAEIMDAVQDILSSARRNNTAGEVTGALLFNEGLFAQVLEGPIDSVERIFEKIQRDPRHSDVTVLQSGTSGHRDFPEWSMAFAAPDAKATIGFGIAAFNAAQSNPSPLAGQVLKLLQQVVVQEDWMAP